jgi:N-acetylglucosaminyldiphosphoundecaprenol N-acetyl-beta-D-mannosaminyltransferase
VILISFFAKADHKSLLVSLLGTLKGVAERSVKPMSSHPQPERVQVLGLPIDRVTMDQTVEILVGFLNSESESTKLIFTADSNAFVNAESDPKYKRLFDEAALITPDSAGPVWALERYGASVPSRVSGVDLLEKLCELSAATGHTMFFLGASPGIAEQAMLHLNAKYSGCKIIGARDGYFKPEDDIKIANEIAEYKPDVLVVAMGMPRQEIFILETAHIIKAKIGIGVGGSLDVHSGNVKRAPKVIQKLKLEWLWRVLLNPKKIDKVKNLPIFYWRVRKATK